MALSQSCPVYPALQWTFQPGTVPVCGTTSSSGDIWGPCSFGFASLLSWNLVFTMSRGCTLVLRGLRGIWQMAAGCSGISGQPRSYNGFHHPSHSTSKGCMVHVWKSIWTAAGLLVQPFQKKGKTRHPEFDATIPFACGLLCWSTCLTVGMLSLRQQKQYKKIACQLARKAPHALGLKHYCSMLGSTVNLNQEIVPNYQRVKRIL